VEVGLFGKPTVVNNVETLANVLRIVTDGGETFARIGTEGSTGPKLFCLSGHVERPGVYEVEFGATLGDLIEMAGGVPGGREIRTILLGGAAGVFVGPDALDMPLTFEATRAAAATLGSGVIMVFDETADLVDTLRRIAQFFRDESCGQCVPCRVGTVRQEELLARSPEVATASGLTTLTRFSTTCCAEMSRSLEKNETLMSVTEKIRPMRMTTVQMIPTKWRCPDLAYQ
jgi:NADH-quinone oxidoreductase subunit F